MYMELEKKKKKAGEISKNAISMPRRLVQGVKVIFRRVIWGYVVGDAMN